MGGGGGGVEERLNKLEKEREGGEVNNGSGKTRVSPLVYEVVIGLLSGLVRNLGIRQCVDIHSLRLSFLSCYSCPLRGANNEVRSYSTSHVFSFSNLAYLRIVTSHKPTSSPSCFPSSPLLRLHMHLAHHRSHRPPWKVCPGRLCSHCHCPSGQPVSY